MVITQRPTRGSLSPDRLDKILAHPLLVLESVSKCNIISSTQSRDQYPQAIKMPTYKVGVVPDLAAPLSPHVLTQSWLIRISSPETRSCPAHTRSKRSGDSSTKLKAPGPTIPPTNVFTPPTELQAKRRPLIRDSCLAFCEIDLVKEGGLIHEPMDEWTFESRIYSKFMCLPLLAAAASTLTCRDLCSVPRRSLRSLEREGSLCREEEEILRGLQWVCRRHSAAV